MPVSKELDDIRGHIFDDIEQALGAWELRRIIPFAQCYSDAYHMYRKTIDQAAKDKEEEHALFATVAMLVGSSVFALAPVAGLLATVRDPLRRGIVGLSQAAGKLGLRRSTAWKRLSEFVFNTAPTHAKSFWESTGKAAVESQINEAVKAAHDKPGGERIVGLNVFLRRRDAMAGLQRATHEVHDKPPTPGWIRTIPGRDAAEPLSYYLEMKRMFVDAAQQLRELASELTQVPGMTVEEMEAWKRWFRKAPFIAEAPRHSIRHPNPTRRNHSGGLGWLADEMELCLYAQHVQDSVYVQERYESVMEQNLNPENLFSRHPVIKIFEPNPKVIRQAFIKRPGYAVERRLHDLGVVFSPGMLACGGYERRNSTTPRNLFGGRYNPTHQAELRVLFAWAHSFLFTRGRRVSPPHSLAATAASVADSRTAGIPLNPVPVKGGRIVYVGQGSGYRSLPPRRGAGSRGNVSDFAHTAK